MTQGNSPTKLAIVTGGSRGLGRNTALNLAKRGVDVIVTYHANRAEAETAVAAIEALGRKAVALQLDVGKASGFAGFVEEVRAVMTRVWDRDRFDYLVNNAGIAAPGTIAAMTEADFDRLVDVHFKGVFFLTQWLLPVMADGGRIVNISSGLARFALPGYAAYGALKGAVEVLTRYMAKELGPRRITVNVVAPGAVETDFGGGHLRDNAELNKFVAAQTALGRVGLPDDIGPMIAVLLSDENRWVNAQRIEVSGGMFL